MENTGEIVLSANFSAGNHLKRSQLGVRFGRGGRARPLRHVSRIQKSGHNCSFLDHTVLQCSVCALSGGLEKSVFGFHKKRGRRYQQLRYRTSLPCWFSKHPNYFLLSLSNKKFRRVMQKLPCKTFRRDLCEISTAHCPFLNSLGNSCQLEHNQPQFQSEISSC